jgi:hypothetical protein
MKKSPNSRMNPGPSQRHFAALSYAGYLAS